MSARTGGCAARCGIMLAFALLPSIRIHAQAAVYVRHGHDYRLVRRVDDQRPCIDNGVGRLVPVDERDYVLRSVPEYAPVFVSVRRVEVGTHELLVGTTGSEMNREVNFRAEFESAYALRNVFVALELDGAHSGPALLLQEIGDLKPNVPKPIRLNAWLNQDLGPGRYRLHVFSDGTEVFQSKIPFDQVERALDAMVKRRIAGVTNAEPRPFTGPAPEYPVNLWRKHVRGQAVIGFVVSETGRVLEPKISSATDPAFGDSALEAARMWRFLPRVRNGKTVATPVEMPFAFVPPGEPVQ
ncbi:MAG TPA: energy transducer TonB [Opitutaceae bacterium]|nr:energy transducer TonB [Opitutaceae bacterium]